MPSASGIWFQEERRCPEHSIHPFWKEEGVYDYSTEVISDSWCPHARNNGQNMPGMSEWMEKSSSRIFTIATSINAENVRTCLPGVYSRVSDCLSAVGLSNAAYELDGFKGSVHLKKKKWKEEAAAAKQENKRCGFGAKRSQTVGSHVRSQSLPFPSSPASLCILTSVCCNGLWRQRYPVFSHFNRITACQGKCGEREESVS